MKHFKGSFIVTALGLTLALILGGFSALYIVALLAILEISLSFDNAVVNAKVLGDMEAKWQERFITWGMPIAVFGMRFLFPILIVAIASGTGVLDTFNMAINNPHEYKESLESVEQLIYAFGGAFLLMVFLEFIFDLDKEEQWIKIIENSKAVHLIGKIEMSKMIIAMGLGVSLIVMTSSVSVALAYFSGILLHAFISSLDKVFNVNGIRQGIVGLLYLEVLDASFSFDGVIGAFALSSDLFIIMIGLGIGAMFVRSLTLYMVKENTLAEYQYLEHGANYAILALALMMFVKMFMPVPEVLIGTIGVSFIALSAYHSVQANKKSVKVLAEK